MLSKAERELRAIEKAKAFAKARVAAEILPPLAQDDGSFVSVLTISETHCRFPIGDPKEEAFAFCGREKCRDAYCADHATLAYQPGTSLSNRRRAADVASLGAR